MPELEEMKKLSEELFEEAEKLIQKYNKKQNQNQEKFTSNMMSDIFLF